MVKDPHSCSVEKEEAMDVTAILIRRNNTFPRVVILLFMAGIAFAQDSPMASPPLTLRSGTILTVRINEPLSSDHNQVGDVFSATLTQPVIAQGVVVASPLQQCAPAQVRSVRTFSRELLPPPTVVYSTQLRKLGRPNRQGWALALCPLSW